MLRRFVVALLFLSAACTSRTAPPVTAPAAPTVAAGEQLRRDLAAIFTAPALDHANWGIDVQSLATGEEIYRYNHHRFLLPASNQKILTSAVAAERLGWDYRFTTRILAAGPIDAHGTLQGDLLIVGSGDPSINPRHETRMKAFDEWAAALSARGLKKIDGRIIGDDNAFAEPGLGFSWSWDNLSYGYGTAVGALQYNENQVVVTVTAGAMVGVPADVTVEPAGHALAIDPQVVTAGAGAHNTVEILRVPGARTLRVFGEIATDTKPATITASVENATQFFVNAFKDALARHGIEAGDALDIDDVRWPPDTASATEILMDRSPPLLELIDVCMKWSRNEYAETFLLALAPPGKPATPTTAIEVLRAQLETWNVPAALYVARDGSGLSRQDYLTPEALTRLLRALWADQKHVEKFRSTLPVSGVSGTLAERMKGTPIESRVWAKTGSLSNVRTLSGYLVTSRGEPIVFSMMVNNYQVPTSEIDAAMERALLRVYESR